MKLKPYKNQYNHEVVDCPFCPYFAYVRPATKTSPDPLRGLKRHIVQAAKNEALKWQCGEAETVGSHLLYYKKHTALRPVNTGIIKRQFDNDLTI